MEYEKIEPMVSQLQMSSSLRSISTQIKNEESKKQNSKEGKFNLAHTKHDQR